MYIIDNLTKNNHFNEIKKIISISDEIMIVSPFCFRDYEEFYDRIIADSGIKAIKLITTLKPDEMISKTESILSFREGADRYKIKSNIFINSHLHGKVYIFKNNGLNTTAIITSANITHNGLTYNHEWGCCFSDSTVIDKLEKNIISTLEYELTEKIIDKITDRVREYKKEHPIPVITKPCINISDILISHRFNICADPSIRIFIKPIGSADNKIFDGDYSQEEEQYFSKKRPAAIRKNDYLIAYAVGAGKIISIFKVTSDVPIHTGETDNRWPWYVEVENITPKLGYIWYKKDLYLTAIANDYVNTFHSILTNNGGKTLGGLQWGCDKIRLDYDFGIYLLSLILDIESNLK